jgi:hypothetical protein
MPQISEQTEQLGDQTLDQANSGDRLFQQRRLLTSRLADIALLTRTALDNAALPLEIFFVIPASGHAMISFGTPGDPLDEDWDRVDQIISNIVGNIVGLGGLHGRELPCITSRPPAGLSTA